MPNKDSHGDQSSEEKKLRARAEEMLRATRTDIAGMSADEIQRMMHELQVHQIELKLQNEELRNAQLELAHSRDLYSDLYEFAPVGYLTLDRKGTIERANLTVADMLGVERNLLTGHKLAEFVVRTSSDDCHRHLQAVFSDGSKTTAELTMIGANDSELVIQLESLAITDDDQDPTRCRTALVDVTEQREASEWILQAKRLRSMVENLPAGAVFVENETIELNRAAEEITGYFRGELSTLDQWYEKLFADRAEAVRESHVAARRDGFAQPALLTIIQKDGDERLVDLVAHGFNHHEVWLINDVTDRKAAEASLRRERGLTESIVNTAQNIILVLDPAGKIIRFNPYFETLTGWALAEVKGKDWLETCVPISEHGSIKRRFERAIAGERTVGLTNHICRNDGGVREIEWYDTKLLDDAGNTIGLLCSGQDVTMRKTLERHVLNIAEEEQSRIGRDLHDGVGQELTGLSMMAKTLSISLEKRSLPESKVAKRIALQIVNTLEQVRQLARGMNPVDIDPQGLNSALGELAEHISGLYGIKCGFICDQKIEVGSSDMATNLYRIAQEAITNAAKHGKADRIDVELADGQSELTLRITDNGVGIKNLKEVESGIGMKSMRYRADIIGGVLSIESVDTEGTVVTCSVRVVR